MEQDQKKKNGIKWNLVGDDKAEAGFNVSWGAIIAGLVTFLALLVTFSLIGSAIGFGTVEPTSSDPFDGVGTGLLVWTIVAFILSLLGAGFVAGVTSRRMGLIHGFLTWATSVLALLLLLSFVTSGIFSTVGSTLSSVFSVAGKGIGTISSEVGDLASKSFDKVVGSVGDVDTDELQEEVKDVLKDTDIKELQPNYLNDQLKAASSDILDAGKEIAVNPDNSDQIIQETKDSLQQRVDTITEAAEDKNAIANAVNENTDLNQQEAEEATNNIYDGLQSASQEAQEKLDQASQEIDKAQQDLDEAIQKARVKADKAADEVSKGSIWGFVALLLGLILTSIAGLLGSNFVSGRNEERM